MRSCSERPFLVPVLAAWWLGCALGPAGAPLAREPRVEVASQVHDFGVVAVGAEVRHVFPVTNLGRRPLTLVPARRGCACSVSVSSGGTLAAGDSGWLEVAFDTTGAAGPTARTVTIETNDPETPELVFALRGTVVAEVTASPPKVFFGRVPHGVARERTVDIETTGGVTIQKVRKEGSRFTLRFVRLAEPRRGIRLYVALAPRQQRGPFDDRIVVTTNGVRQPILEIPVLGFVQ